ncbi:autotransporter assembly complex protein TamA [[Pasteurella] aerogenes]|nr:autotransporter assembly complex protein TamA [[Pasteurella] aerogenes]
MKLFANRKGDVFRPLCYLGLICMSVAAKAEYTVDLKVTGVRGEKAIENVDIYTSMIDKEEADGSERYQQLVRDAINKGLRVYGYYNAEINFTLQPRKNQKPLLVADVKAGKPALIEDTDIQILGEAKDDKAFDELNRKVAKKGDMMYHSVYDDYKSSLQKLATGRGYFDAEFNVSRLEVLPSTNQAWWRIVFDSKERYRFGKITFAHSQIREDYLQNIMQIKEGDYYLINELSKLTNSYSSSGWFSSVLLQPTLHEDQKTVDIEVITYPRKKNAMDVGIGYSTDVGPRFQFGWTKPWINSRGHSFRSHLYLSSPKQSIEATYKIPLLKNPLNYYYEFSAGAENEHDNSLDTDTTSATFAALRYWNRTTGWQNSLGLRVRYDSFTQGSISDKTLLVYPTASVSRTRMKGGLFATWGDSQRLTVDVGQRGLLSDVSFVKIQASSAWVRTFAENHRFLVRAELGWLHTSDIQHIPPALRFFAGGDRSVRGYGYKKISPKDENRKYIGASRLATGTLEYQYQVYPDWWLATFADSGLAAESYSTSELRYGAGIGIRWASPIGAIKFDIATPIRDKDDSKNIQFYIGLGSDL